MQHALLLSIGILDHSFILRKKKAASKNKKIAMLARIVVTHFEGLLLIANNVGFEEHESSRGPTIKFESVDFI
jgi:hypothetical protein